MHTCISNASTILDSVANYKQYINRAKELGMKSIAISEHGTIFEWLHKFEYCDKSGLKYIHGAEFYVTESLSEKVRDNYHLGMYAKNAEGFKEINLLTSKSFNREDGSYHYSPRITIEDVYGTSDNIIITTACLGGVLNKGSQELQDEFVKFLAINKHRCFLEVQHHNVEEQSVYNKKLLALSKQHGIPLIAGTDTHSLNKDQEVTRKILQARKGVHFGGEDGWDTIFKTYDELVDAYKNQNSLSEDDYLKAIENTNMFADMIEPFEVDRSYKYPKLSDNPLKDVNDRILKGYIEKGIANKPNKKVYDEKIKYELDVYKMQGMLDFLLLDSGIKDAMRSENRHVGYSRGSVSGSLIAWLMGITEVDSIKYGLYFERFVSKERIAGIGDIDSDWSPSDRPRVKDYIHNDMKQKYSGLYTAEIVTFNTNAIKNSWKDITGGLRELSSKGLLGDIVPQNEIPTLEETDLVSKTLEGKESEHRLKYPNIFKYVDLTIGVITSIGSHPAGTIVSPIPIDANYGTATLPTSVYPITVLNMKELDSLNAVKLDVLGLDNVEIINKGCKLAGIDRLTPDNMDFEDTNVWDNMKSSPVGIFQFEQQFAHSLLSKALTNIHGKSRIDIMSAVNGAIRPSGESFREDLCNGVVKDNGCKPLNDLLGNTLGQCLYQEDILAFLNKFCGFSLGDADVVRRAIAKKTGTESLLPKIRSGFLSAMKQYGIEGDEAEHILESFLIVIDDASQYGFSLNHSQPYSMIGFACAYLRTYYPLEFLTVALGMNENNMEKSATFLQYMKDFTDIQLKQARFRRSKGDYFPNKEEKIIYKGVGSIKGLNSNIGDLLYELRDTHFSNFFDFLQTATFLNKTQIENLIKIDYFQEFGKSKKLQDFYTLYRDWIGKKTIKIDKLPEVPFDEDMLRANGHATEKQISKIDFAPILREHFENMSNDDYSIQDKIQFQQELLGYASIQIETDPQNCFVMDVVRHAKFINAHPRIIVMSLSSGKIIEAKIDSQYLTTTGIKKGDLVKIHSHRSKPIQFKDEQGKWQTVPDKKQLWFTNVDRIHERDL